MMEGEKRNTRKEKIKENKKYPYRIGGSRRVFEKKIQEKEGGIEKNERK